MHITNLENRVCIIIVTYNALRWIEKCLQSCEGHQVIVVDNASQDATVSEIKSLFRDVILLEQSENRGFGCANNLGIEKALEMGVDYVFLLNQDAYLQKGCLDRLISVHKNNQDFGLLSPVHLNGSGRVLDAAFSGYCSKSDEANLAASLETRKRLKDVYELPFVNAAAWLIPLQTLDVVGGFDPIFFMYGEDDNYCQRVLYHGFKVGVVSGAFIQHDRENRVKSPIIPFSKDDFRLKKRRFLVKWSNPFFTGWKQDFKRKIKNRLSLFLRAFITLNFQMAQNRIKEIKVFIHCYFKVKKTKSLNYQRGRTHLV